MPDSNQREVEQRWTGDVLSREIAAGGSVDPGAPHRVQEALSHTLALPLWRASRVWWSAGISLVMQITTRWKRRFDGAVDRASPYIEKLLGRRRHLYICSRCGMPIESWPKEASRQQIKEQRTTDSAKAAGPCRFLRFPTRLSSDDCDSPSTDQ